jgi:hypothetical protein
MKKLKKTILVSIVVCVFALSLAPASVATGGTLLFEDDFESYDVGEVPSAKWYTYAYSGGYPCDNRVRLFEDNKVLCLYSERWAAVASAKVDRLLNYSIEADIYMMPRDIGTCEGACFCLRTGNRDTPHLRGGYAIKFQPDSDRVAVWILDWPNPDSLIGEAPCEIDYYTWYKVKALVTGDRYGEIKVQVFLNDMTTPVLETIDDGTKWESYSGDAAGYTSLSGYYSGPIYYDNIKIYEVAPAIPATVDIDPDTLNLKSKGKWITCYIELPDGYSVEDIDIDSVTLTKINEDLLDPPLYCLKLETQSLQCQES